MSSDLLEGCEDSKGNSIELSMKATGYAFLFIGGYGMWNDFVLSPDAAGIVNAKMIEKALAAWRTHIEESNEV